MQQGTTELHALLKTFGSKHETKAGQHESCQETDMLFEQPRAPETSGNDDSSDREL